MSAPVTWDQQCGTCDKVRDGCDFCCGTNTGDGSHEELTSGDVLDQITDEPPEPEDHMTDLPLYVNAPWSQITGIPVRKHPLLPDGQVIITDFNVVPVSGPVVLIGTHSTDLTRAARSARLTVRRGLADVLAWLGQPVENEPTGDEIWDALQRKANR